MIEIHADFNRDGRVELTPSEYALRSNGFGAVLAPNLDVDARGLPSGASTSSGILFDHTRTVKAAIDNDLLPFSIRLLNFPLPAGHVLKLKLDISLGDDVQIYDHSRNLLAFFPRGNFKEYTIAVSRAITSLFLEIKSYAFSPKGTTRRGQTQLGSDVFLDAVIEDGMGNTVGADRGNFTLAPLILSGDLDPVERLYMAQVADNLPTQTDLSAAARLAGVPLILIPNSIGNGDTWIQDQFQLGYSQTPSGVERVIFHLPRMRSDSTASPGTLNLATFIDSHFPSRDLGVFRDFWTRDVSVMSARGQSEFIPFQEAEYIHHKMDRGYRIRSEIMSIFQRFDNNAFIRESLSGPTFFDLRMDIQRLAALAATVLQNAASRTTVATERNLLNAKRTVLSTAVSGFMAEVPIGSFQGQNTITLSTPNTSVEVIKVFSDRLEVELDKKLSSLNYGGNIEVSPPDQSARYGKIVLGNLSFQDRRKMDPQLSDFLLEQRVQPIVNINTEWLDVGHVDEIMTFVPSPRFGSSGNAILRASPGIALNILDHARELFYSGVSDALRGSFSPRFTVHFYERNMGRGRHPITKMLRGKFWLHRHTSGPLAPPPLEPPRIYKFMVDHWASVSSPYLNQNLPYTPGAGPDRFYPAGLSVEELFGFDNFTNHCLEKVLFAARPVIPDAISGGSIPTSTAEEQVAEDFNTCLIGEGFPDSEKQDFKDFLDANRLEDILKRSFPNHPLIGLPVLFDRFDNWATQRTIAFLPDLVNLQQSGRNVFISRPYGPRMRIDDAILVITSAMGGLDASFRSQLNRRSIISKGLHLTWHWHDGGSDASSRVSLNDIARYFSDGFILSDGHPMPLEEVERSISRDPRNGGKISGGFIRPGWQKLFIQEGMVDLFELYTQLVLERLGLTVHWVDSWYYHIHSGGIHCGTNALRTIRPARSNAWWNYPLLSTS